MKRILTLLCSVAFFGSVASADIMFTTATGAGGTLSWTGSSAPLVGSGIGLAGVTGLSTLSNAGFHFINGPLPGCYFPSSCGDLEFSTGAFLGVVTGAGGQNVLEFGSGGTFMITGGVMGSTMPADTVLLSGQFTGIWTLDTQTGVFSASTGSGLGTVAGLLLDYFGINTTEPFTFTAQVLGGGVSTSVLSPFGVPVNSTQINSSAVPEPASIVLLSLALLLGCTTLRRHRFNRRA
jgi:hypothetical protein